MQTPTVDPTIIEPMPGRDVGRVLVQMKLENADDLSRVACGDIAAAAVRTAEFTALVDTGAKYVGLPASDIARLGLRYLKTKNAKTAAGPVMQRIFSAVRFTVQERDGLSEVAELPDGSPALLGQLPIEQIDFWVDMTNHKLVGNPEHGGEWMIDMY